jgi:competence protein ComEA
MRMPTIARGRVLVYLVLVLALLVVGGRYLLGDPAAGAKQAAPVAEVPLQVETQATEQESSELVVHVVGAVRRPGLYRLPAGSRVADGIGRAGGARRKAALALVNLAAPVTDGQQIVVPFRGVPPPASSPALPGAAPGPINLNTASLEELDALPGVGPVTAQRIIDYRDKHGRFESVDELDAVSGIGPARLEQLRELLVP